MIKLLISIIIVTSLIGCVSALDGSGMYIQPGYTSGTVSQYSQYYTMTAGSALGTHIIAPKQYQISGKFPATVYFNNQQQAMPYTQYQTYATTIGGNSLWIQGATSWTQYATVPQGAYLSLIATSSNGGNGNLNEIYPDGRLLKNNYYYFPGYNQIGFWADTIGQHIMLFIINGQVSNAIVIDVVGYQPPVYQQPVYQQPAYLQPSYVSPIYYSPIFFHPGPHRGNASPTEYWLD